MDEAHVVEGGCMCGAVRFQASGEPFWVGHCHCRSCRRHTGAPVATFVAYKVHQIAFTKGARRIYNSSPGVERGFCGDCGTPLTWEGQSIVPERGKIVEFYISLFDDPDRFRPTNHVWYKDRIAWFDVSDGLPRYHEFDSTSDIDRYGPATDGLPT